MVGDAPTVTAAWIQLRLTRCSGHGAGVILTSSRTQTGAGCQECVEGTFQQLFIGRFDDFGRRRGASRLSLHRNM